MLRYSKQEDLVDQDKLKNASVLIAGVGGLGGFSSMYLALAGVGNIVIVDKDVVEESNLNRQILYREGDIGKKKVMVARKRLKDLNPDVKIIAIDKSIDEKLEVVQKIDIVVDGLDNYESRIALEKFALQKHIPYVFGAVEGYMGMVTFIDNSTKKLEDFIQHFKLKTSQVLASTAAFTASIQAMEVLKYLSNKGDLLRNRLLIYDALSTNFLEVKL